MTTSNQSSSGGIGFTGALQLLFIGLKLAGFIQWSWWWVMAPTWIPLLIIVALLCVLVLISALIDRP